MTLDTSKMEQWASLQRDNESRRPSRDLKGGGGDGTSDGMEARVNRLEGRLDKMTDKIGAVEVNLATLTERVSHLPSKGFIVSSALATITLLTAVMIFADKLRALIG